MLDSRELLVGAVFAAFLAMQSGANAVAPDSHATSRSGLRHMLVLSETLKHDARTRTWAKAQVDIDDLRSTWRSARPYVISTAHGTRYAFSIDQNLTGLSNAILGENATSVVQMIKISTSMQRSLNDILERKWDLF